MSIHHDGFTEVSADTYYENFQRPLHIPDVISAINCDMYMSFGGTGENMRAGKLPVTIIELSQVSRPLLRNCFDIEFLHKPRRGVNELVSLRFLGDRYDANSVRKADSLTRTVGDFVMHDAFFVPERDKLDLQLDALLNSTDA